jgi:hypothetical protein
VGVRILYRKLQEYFVQKQKGVSRNSGEYSVQEQAGIVSERTGGDIFSRNSSQYSLCRNSREYLSQEQEEIYSDGTTGVQYIVQKLMGKCCARKTLCWHSWEYLLQNKRNI